MQNKKPHSSFNNQRPSFARENPFTPNPEQEFSDPMKRIMASEDRKTTFYKILEEALASEYDRVKNDVENDRIPIYMPKYPIKEGETPPTIEEETNYYFNLLKNECYEFLEPLHDILGDSVPVATEATSAFDHLGKLHDLLDKICDMLDQNYKMQVYMNELKTLTELKHLSEFEDVELSELESDLEASISFLGSILESAKSTSTKRNNAKQRARERSKSVFVSSANQPTEKDPKPPPIRRQSAFTEGKSKVSKWTKVKAAFKWERANVPALNECKSSDSGLGFLPTNHEVARYLRVPSIPCGGSSADSILSSSSGHLLSEIGTPGTISSASSVDDIERATQTSRRDSSKSDSKCEFRPTIESDSHRSHSIDGELGSLYNRMEIKDSSPFHIKHQRYRSESSDHKNSPTTSQSSLDRLVDVVKKPASFKGLRKSKIISDFEVLPEDVIVDITSSRPKREKTLPSPLNLSLRHDLSESDCPDYSHSPNTAAKSPWEKTKCRKFQSPVNSSVPSSPSRHSEFFPEFAESEDLSSGDFSEPTTPHNKLFSSNSLHMQQEEINQRYYALRDKLKKEFEAKRKEWEKIRSIMSNHPKTSAYHLVSKEDPPQQHQVKIVSTKVLEENLTPDFKKKLHKWRVKKQSSLHGNAPCKEPQISPTKDPECKKIDWNLWRTGQLKLEGQGLSPLPDQKDLPEDFQRKLEQWNKMKSCGLANSGHDITKAASKCELPKKSHEDDKQKPEKPRTHERDKFERLSKLKAIVADPRAKEIEVKTTAGVMKFEGISRKFTRKLYEWEKARGIGPESSTFALLHPGYCPIDVGKIPKECKKNENSPTLSRSLSLDSVAPNAPLPTISHQTSSLSLNDVNDLNEAESTDAELRADCDLKQQDYPDEPEAVMVEVEDDIVETASPLVAVLPMVEHQTPVYRYAEVTCSDFCKSRSVQSFESHHSNDGDKIKTLNYINDLWLQLESRNEFSDENLRYFQSVFATMRSSFPDFENNLNSSGAKRSFIKAKELVEELFETTVLLLQEEACCQELIDERQVMFRNNLDDLHTTLNEVRQFIESERSNSHTIPDINVTYDEGRDSVSSALANTAMAVAAAAFSTTIDISDDITSPVFDSPDLDAVRKINNRNGNSKKKLRLRKMGSRQNSKTESDSSDEECASIVETPRRVKRKPSSRIKQRSFDEDRKSAEENRPQDDTNGGEDIVYVLKVKPGQPIEQQEICQEKSSKLLISPTETCVQLIHNSQPETHSTAIKSNVFVKTKRKVFTTLEEPGTSEKVTVVVTELTENNQNPLPAPSVTQQLNEVQPKNCPNDPLKPSISPGIQNMISILSESMPLEKIVSSSNHLRSNAFPGEPSHIYKSVSTSSIFAEVPKDDRKEPKNNLMAKSSSFANLKKGWEFYQTNPTSYPLKTRIPLANDSFRLIKKVNPIRISRDSQSPVQMVERREHLFRKNRSGSPVVRLSAKGKRIESKIAKSTPSPEVPGYPLTPDKSDNTIPRITRKLENKSLTPTIKCSNFFQEIATTPSVSEPSTPMTEKLEKPRTPLSERAIRLQKAKEEFLKSGALPKTTLRRDDNGGHQTKEKTENRRSHQSMSSDVSISGLDEISLSKSISIGTLQADSDCSVQPATEGYDSMPRSVSRSGKLTSKLGFATLASKFRNIKLRRGSKDSTTQPTAKDNALSILCRQSLFVDLNPVTQQNLMKSQSSQAAIGGMRAKLESSRTDPDNLNKSKSEHFFPRIKKESCV